MQHFDTLSEALQVLKTEGYTADLNLKKDSLECKALGLDIPVEDFWVDKVFRFEGDSNPDDSSVLFAISSDKYDLKGVLVDAYGTYANPLTEELIDKLRYDPNRNSG